MRFCSRAPDIKMNPSGSHMPMRYQLVQKFIQSLLTRDYELI